MKRTELRIEGEVNLLSVFNIIYSGPGLRAN